MIKKGVPVLDSPLLLHVLTVILSGGSTQRTLWRPASRRAGRGYCQMNGQGLVIIRGGSGWGREKTQEEEEEEVK
jgi:hypothetical protein